MKLLTIPALLLLLITTQKAQSKSRWNKDFQNGEAGRLDSTRAEFNLKKKNTAYLIRGKGSAELLTFFEYYLQEKDHKRADSLVNAILKSTDAVDYRYQISLISYRYTLNTRTQQLFLADMARLKEYRSYFLKLGVSALKSNPDLRAHYVNLVALDSAYYKIAPDSLVKVQIGRHYNSLAWYSMLTLKLNDVENYIHQSMKFDPVSKYPYSNMPLYLLLKGRYQEAKLCYMKLKDQPFDTPDGTYKDVFLEDFKELAAAGITNKDIKKITQLLNSRTQK